MKKGYIYTITAFCIWGLFPLYWKLLKHVSPLETLGHRMVWTFVFLLIIISAFKQWTSVKKVLIGKKSRLMLLMSGIFLSVNWLIYIWAVNNNHIIDASLGYFINPLFSVVLGVVFLKERLYFYQAVAVVIALAGILFLIVDYGKVPYVALSLAFSFGMYGIIRKTVAASSQIGLFTESIYMLPVALGFLIYWHSKGNAVFSPFNTPTFIFFILGGPITAIPLLLFAKGTRILPLSTVGFLQYITPTSQFLIGFLLYKEVFTVSHQISFSLIWIALIVFSFAGTGFMHSLTPSPFRPRKDYQAD